MASANWVCRALLLLSLCLGLCYGNRGAGLIGQHSTMDHVRNDVVAKDDNHENMVSKNMSNINGDNKIVYRGYLPIGDVDGVFCSTDGCYDQIVVPDPRRFLVGCGQLSGYSQCSWRMNDVDAISEYIRGIQAKLDETCCRNSIDSMNMATASSAAMPPN